MSGKASSVRPRAADDDDDGVGAESSSPSSPSSPSSKIADAVLLSCLVPYTLAFAFFRIAEIFACCLDHGSACVSALLGTIVLSRSSLGRGLRSRCLLHVFSLILGAHVLDRVVPASLPTPSQLPPGRTVVVTGANAGIGYETSRRLAVDYGARVIMGCRSRGRCDEAAAAINAELKERGGGASSSGSATPMLVDLSSFESVESFASILLADDRGTANVVDVLFNNAGYAPREGEPVNAVGLESSFASMHLGHFYLTELLLRENPRMRVVNTSSGTHHMCAMLSLRGSRRRRGESPGCIDDAFFRNGVRSPSDGLAYVRAKLANAMHAVELPRRHPGATAIAIDLGWVGTAIQPFMRGGLLTPAGLGMMRTARVGVMPVLMAILSSDETLSNDLGVGVGVGGRRKLNDAGFTMNPFGRCKEAFSLPWWRDGGVDADMSRDAMVRIGERLWDESVKILQGHGHLL